MDVTVTNKDGVTVAALAGKLDSASAMDAQDKAAALIKPGVKMVIDLKQCEFVSSAGLRALLITAKAIRKAEGTGAMSNVAEEIKDVMEMTGFDDMFDIYDSTDAAVKALK